MTQQAKKLPTNPQRVEAFANFFKRYMSISTIVAAALPIPVTALNLIPTLPFQTGELSVYTPLFCFLILAFVFYNRHMLARWMFGTMFSTGGIIPRIKEMLVNVLPLSLILVDFGTIIFYRYSLINVVMNIHGEVTPGEVSDLDQIKCMALYLAIFVIAETAFVLMAMKEYLQDYLNLEDSDLIFGSVGITQTPSGEPRAERLSPRAERLSPRAERSSSSPPSLD